MADEEYKNKLAQYRISKQYIKDHFGPKPKWQRGVRKFTNEEVKYIRQQYAIKGATELSKEFDTTITTIVNVGRGLTYKHLNFKFKPQY